MRSLTSIKISLHAGSWIFAALSFVSCNLLKTEVTVKTAGGANKPSTKSTSDTQFSLKIVSPQDGAYANSLNYKAFSLAGTCSIDGTKIILNTTAADNSALNLGSATCAKSTWNIDFNLQSFNGHETNRVN